MSRVTKETIAPINRNNVLVVRKTRTARLLMPVDHVTVDCLMLGFVGLRTQLGADAVPEESYMAIPDENIFDVLDHLVEAAQRYFPDEMRGVSLVRDHRE